MVHVSGTTKEYVVCTRMARQLVTIGLPVVSTVPAVHQYTCNIQGTEASSGAAAAKTRLSLSNEASDDLTIRRRTKKKKIHDEIQLFIYSRSDPKKNTSSFSSVLLITRRVSRIRYPSSFHVSYLSSSFRYEQQRVRYC